MRKTPTRNRQLELPVLVTLAGGQTPPADSGNKAGTPPPSPAAKAPAQASAQDQAIYRAISDNYFRNLD
ncbi:hypothetical protein P3T42_005916 [Paraburkholderia sp. GAS38]